MSSHNENIIDSYNNLKSLFDSGVPEDVATRIAAAHLATIIACDLLECPPTSSESPYKKAIDFLNSAESELDDVDPALLTDEA